MFGTRSVAVHTHHLSFSGNSRCPHTRWVDSARSGLGMRGGRLDGYFGRCELRIALKVFSTPRSHYTCCSTARKPASLGYLLTFWHAQLAVDASLIVFGALHDPRIHRRDPPTNCELTPQRRARIPAHKLLNTNLLGADGLPSKA